MAGADQRPGEGGGRHRDRLARRERLPVHDGETVRHHHSLTLVSVPAALTRISAKLGVQTVINDPYEFKVRRRAGRRGRRTLEWHPLPKGVAHLQRYACPPRPTTTTSMPWPSSTTRPGSPCPRPPRAASARLPRPIVACLQPRDHPRPPPCSPLCSAGSTRSTASATATCGRGCSGLQRRPIAGAARRSPASSNASTSAAGREDPRSRRWRITQLGHTVLSAVIHLREDQFPAACFKAAV